MCRRRLGLYSHPWHLRAVGRGVHVGFPAGIQVVFVYVAHDHRHSLGWALMRTLSFLDCSQVACQVAVGVYVAGQG